MRQRARELKSQASAAEGERQVLAKIAEMPPDDRTLATRIHAIVTSVAPDLVCRTWYGMPAYARAGEVVCFFQAASTFKVRYASLGFTDKAHLDDGRMWPSAYALVDLTPVEEARIRDLVRRAVG